MGYYQFEPYPNQDIHQSCIDNGLHQFIPKLYDLLQNLARSNEMGVKHTEFDTNQIEISVTYREYKIDPSVPFVPGTIVAGFFYRLAFFKDNEITDKNLYFDITLTYNKDGEKKFFISAHWNDEVVEDDAVTRIDDGDNEQGLEYAFYRSVASIEVFKPSLTVKQTIDYIDLITKKLFERSPITTTQMEEDTMFGIDYNPELSIFNNFIFRQFYLGDGDKKLSMVLSAMTANVQSNESNDVETVLIGISNEYSMEEVTQIHIPINDDMLSTEIIDQAVTYLITNTPEFITKKQSIMDLKDLDLLG